MMIPILALAAAVSGGVVASGAGAAILAYVCILFDRLFRKEGETAEFPDFGRAQGHRHAFDRGRVHGVGLFLYLDQRLADPF